jgi:hypothetical protein
MKKNSEEGASDIVFKTVYKVSEDMLGLVHLIVKDHSKYDGAFRKMAASLSVVNRNLKNHILDNKKFSKSSKTKVQKKIDQSKGLIDLCLGYANKCKKIADEMITLTEGLEKDKKMRGIIANLVRRLEEETKSLKDQQAADQLEIEEEDPEIDEESDDEPC